jgi:acetyl-CoA carboxylase carboxyl transferase subunit beta
MMRNHELFKKEKTAIASTKEEEKTVRTEGVFTKCEGCRAFIYKKDLDANEKVCPKCGFHFRLSSKERLEMLFDDRTYQVMDQNLVTTDPLHFVDREPYAEKIAAAQKSTGLNDALVNAWGLWAGDLSRYPPWSIALSAARWVRSSAKCSRGQLRDPSANGGP